MIFVFDESLEGSDVKAKGILAKFIAAIVEKMHYVKASIHIWQWVEREVLTCEFLGMMDIELIRKNNEFRDITGTMAAHLSQVNVGFGSGYIEPCQAILLVNTPSYIVVENEANDWPVLRKWIELMKNDRIFKSVNMLVEKKKCTGGIRPYNAGSAGQIINTLSERMAEFGELSVYKLIAVYDSDKEAEDAELSNEKKKIQDFSIDNRLMHHRLYKREMENYFNIECYKEAQLADDCLAYPLSVLAWDFEDVEKYIKNNSKRHYKKQNLPVLSNYINKQELMNITAHHPLIHNGMSISEVQSLILKFAKLV